MSDQPYLQIRNLTKSFGSFLALNDVSLDIAQGEFVCFLGPSGCGKTTLLRCIAGLEEPDTGVIVQAGHEITRLPPSKRDFGIVFQSYALFPNLTAAKNIAYGLVNKRQGRRAIRVRVQELLDLVGLPDEGRKFPSQLSGGQQQRIALARALALSPGMLLLDEPLSALDARVRATLRIELAGLQRRLGITTIMVTHDQEEALTMADRIVVMERGAVQQVGTPLEIYQRPQTPFVADFVGVMNFLPGTVTGPDQVICGGLPLRVLLTNGFKSSTPVRIAIRPEDVRLADIDRGAANVVQTSVTAAQFLGSYYRLNLKVDHSSPPLNLTADLSIQVARGLHVVEQMALPAQLPEDHLRIFDA